MASTGEQLAQHKQRIDSLTARVIGLTPAPSLYAAMGALITFGCKVTEGDSAADFTILLEGQASGDSANLNPDASLTPLRGFQYPNIANLSDGSFFSTDLTLDSPVQPSTGLARYDIAYIFVGPTGPGFSVATGTPSAGVKSDFVSNGLRTTDYDELTDAALPLGGFPVARIYLDDTSTGIANAQIADLRSFEGRLAGTSGINGTTEITFSIAGELIVGSSPMRWYFDSAVTVAKIIATVGTAATGASIIFDVNKNGSTIFTTQANRPTIAASGFTDLSSIPNITGFTSGDYLTIDVDQIGSTLPGQEAVIRVVLAT